jgi:hypothetical protein
MLNLGDNGRISAATPRGKETDSALRYTNLFRLSPSAESNGLTDVNGWNPDAICIDTETWGMQISGDNIRRISWRETATEVVIVVQGSIPDDNGKTISASTPESKPIEEGVWY